MSEGLTIAMEAFKDFFKEEFTNIIARKISKTLEKSVNQLIIRDQGLIPISDSLNVNYTLTDDPVFEDEYISFGFDGRLVDPLGN